MSSRTSDEYTRRLQMTEPLKKYVDDYLIGDLDDPRSRKADASIQRGYKNTTFRKETFEKIRKALCIKQAFILEAYHLDVELRVAEPLIKMLRRGVHPVMLNDKLIADFLVFRYNFIHRYVCICFSMMCNVYIARMNQTLRNNIPFLRGDTATLDLNKQMSEDYSSGFDVKAHFLSVNAELADEIRATGTKKKWHDER